MANGGDIIIRGGKDGGLRTLIISWWGSILSALGIRNREL